MSESSDLNSWVAPIEKAATQFYDAARDHFTQDIHTAADGSASLWQRATAVGDLGLLAVAVGTIRPALISRLGGAEALADEAVLGRAAAITGSIDSTVSLTSRLGLTPEEFATRAGINDLVGVDVRVLPNVDTYHPDLVNLRGFQPNRTPGALGTVLQGADGEGWYRVQHASDGTIVPYRAEELEPAKIADASPSPKDPALVLQTRDAAIPDLRVGDVLERNGTLEGVSNRRQPWWGGVWTERASGGSGQFVPGGYLFRRDGATLVDAAGKPLAKDPLDVAPGDLLNITHPRAMMTGLHKVTEVDGLNSSSASHLLSNEYRITSLTPGSAELQPLDSSSLSGNFDQGERFTVSTEFLREPTLRRIEPLSVKPGDQLVAPTGARLPHYGDWNFAANLQGRQLTVLGVQDNGAVLSNGSEQFLVPHDYLHTRTMFRTTEWEARTGS